MKIEFGRVLGWLLLLLNACSTAQFSGPPPKSSMPQRPPVSSTSGAVSNPKNVLPTRAQGLPVVRYRSVRDSLNSGSFYLQARQKYDVGNRKEALVDFQAYLNQNPSGQFADEALFILAKQSFDNNDAETAAQYFNRVATMNPPSKLRGDALYYEALSNSQLGNRSKGLINLAKIDFREVSVENRAKVFSFWGKIAADEGRLLESTLAFIKARRELVLPAQRKEMETEIEDLIENRLNERELEFLVKEYPSDYPNGETQLRLANLQLAQGNRPEATAILEGILATQVNGTPIHTRASQMLARMRSLGDARIDRVGAVLPLSGPLASAGRSIADGLQLGLKNSVASSGIELVVADSGKSLESAAKAFERLVFEEKVMGLVGPPGGSQAELLAKKSGEYGIPYIATAARPGLVENGGPFVFRMALTPERQVRALVGYAKERLGARRFAILFPEDNFGRECASEFFRAVKDFDGEVTAAESYQVGQTDFKVQIDNMSGLGVRGFRQTEYQELLAALEESLQRKATRKETRDLLKPVVDFDVLFIPEKAKTLGQIIPALSAAFATEKMPKLMGPSTWKSSETLLRTGQYLDNAILVDAWSQERQSKSTQDFVEKFQIKKGSLPDVFSAQGFDIGTAIRLAYGNGRVPSGRDELRARLENLGSVDGTLGMQVWDSRREVLSELQLYQIKHGAFVHQGGITIKPK